MNPEIFAEWLCRQGHRVYKSKSSYWVDQGPLVYQSFPYHVLIRPDGRELTGFLKEKKAIGLRFSAPMDAVEGSISYHAVYENCGYDFNNLRKWARKNVRRGLSRCKIDQLSFDLLATEGFHLQIDTLDRQGRLLDLEEKDWRNRCLAAKDLPGFEAWGAFVKGKLAASVITFQMLNYCYMLYQQCHRNFLSDHVNNALSFVVTKTMIERPQINGILYGLHSLDAPPSVDEFKFRMGYSAKPVRQRAVFHPWAAPFFNNFSHGLLRSAARKWPGNPTLAKAEGMVRFYLQGRLPIDQQPLPPVIEHFGE